MKCDICGKSTQFGHNVSHSNRHTRRQWSPNIHRATLVIEGKARRLKVCTRCLRSYSQGKIFPQAT